MQRRCGQSALAVAMTLCACGRVDTGPPPSLRPERVPPGPTAPPASSWEPAVHSDRHLPAYFGGTLLATADGSRAIVSDPDRDQIAVIDLASSTERTVALEVDDEPGRAVEDADGRVHVVLRRAGSVATIDVAGARLVARHRVCAAPRGIAWDPAAGLIYVACAGGELVSMRPDGAELRTRQLAPDLRDVVVIRQGLVVSRFRTAEAFLVRPEGTIVQIGAPHRDSDHVALVAWSLVSNGEQTLLVHQQARLVPLRVTPPNAANSPEGSYGGGEIDDSLLPSRSMISELTDLDTAAPRWVIHRSVPLPGPAIDAAMDTQGGALIAVSTGVGIASRQAPQVVVISQAHLDDFGRDTTATFTPFFGGAGGYAVAAAVHPDGRLLVELRSPHALLAVQSVSNLAGRPTIIPLGRRETDPDSFQGDSVSDTGRDLFFATTPSGLACASCHPDGGDDGHVWSFEGLGDRRTPSLRGGILATAPFHWDGSLGSFSILAHEVFTRRMGGGDVREDQRAALAAWVDGVPSVPLAPPTDGAPIARGEALFRSPETGCMTCHSGAKFTNNHTVDVGTGEAFQVPSLMGLAVRAPYMHAGCAATLARRFDDPTCGGGDRHGHTSQLTVPQVDDLVAYLSTL